MILTHTIRQSTSAIFEYLAYPILMFASTPYFLKQLGTEHYGQWMLLMAMSGIGGLAGLGMGAATTKEISSLRGNHQASEAGNVVRTSLAIALLGISLLILLGVIVAVLAPSAWFQKIGVARDVHLLAIFSALIITIEQMDSVYTGTIRGYERFDLSARIEIGAKLSGVILALLCVSVTANLLTLFSVLAVASLTRTILKAYCSCKLTASKTLFPEWHASHIDPLFRFGKWTWLQSLGASLFATIDRLLVGSILGSTALSSFAVLTQLAQQIHAIPMAASAVLFPVISRKTVQGYSVVKIVVSAFVVILVLIFAIALPLYFYGNQIIALWLGKPTSVADSKVFSMLVLGFTMLAMNIVPHYVILGFGQAHLVAIVNIIAGAISLIVCFWGLSSLGVIGGAYAKMVYGITVSVLFLTYLLKLKNQS